MIGIFTAYGQTNTCSQHSGTTATIVDDKGNLRVPSKYRTAYQMLRSTRAKRVGSSTKVDGRPLHRIDTRLPGTASSTGEANEDKRPRNRYATESVRLLGVLDERLAGRDWVMGADYSIAPGVTISRRDFAVAPLPHASPDYATALSSPATLAAPPRGALELSEALIQEVEAADVIVIGTPVNNLTVPSVLKAWIDQILRARRTFMSTPAGKVGMLRDRPVFIGIASGGVFTGERANQPDFLTPYLSVVLGSVGLKTVQFLSVQATGFLEPDQTTLAREKALAAIDLTVMVPCL